MVMEGSWPKRPVSSDCEFRLYSDDVLSRTVGDLVSIPSLERVFGAFRRITEGTHGQGPVRRSLLKL